MTAFVSIAVALGLLAAAWLTHPLWWRRPRPSPAFAAVLALFMFGIAGGGYAWLGSPDSLGESVRQPPTAMTLDQMATVAERKLALDPNNPKALALAGAVAFERKDYRTAVQYLERLERIEPADSPYAQEIRAGLAQARQLAGMADGAGVSGTVSLAPSLKSRVAPDDTVFVFARAVDGPRMPLAVLRLRAKDLPARFTLDDSMAMSPQARLSGVSRVVVGARISKSGNAMPQAGDLQGLAPAVDVGASGVQVEINDESQR